MLYGQMTYEVRAFQTLVAVDFENRIVETRRYLAYGTGLATASGAADPERVGVFHQKPENKVPS